MLFNASLMHHRHSIASAIADHLSPLDSDMRYVTDSAMAFFMNKVVPGMPGVHDELDVRQGATRFTNPPKLEALREEAKDTGLWNLWCPIHYQGNFGAGLSNLRYATFAEMMGHWELSAFTMGCMAPFVGNKEVALHIFNQAQQERWLGDIMDETILTSYAMTEERTFGSNPRNLATSMRRDGDTYIINGEKSLITGALNAKMKLLIVMLKIEGTGQMCQVLVPVDTAGVEIKREPYQTMGYDDAPIGHGKINFTNVRVPVSNLLMEEGKGFEIAQRRLGPGRIHHIMRCIGAAEALLELLCQRLRDRDTGLGVHLADKGGWREKVGQCVAEIEFARVNTLHVAHQMDLVVDVLSLAGPINRLKIVVPEMLLRIANLTQRAYGGHGLMGHYPISSYLAYAQQMCMVDGSTETHQSNQGKIRLGQSY